MINNNVLNDGDGVINDICLVMPVYNESGNLITLCQRVFNTLDNLNKKYEVIFIEDGSSDDSFKILMGLKNTFPLLKIIKLKTRFGQSAALSLGLHFSRAEFVITMDSDLQNLPEDIPLFLETISRGYDLVCGWRKERNDPYFTKVLPSNLGNAILAKVSGVHLHDSSCTFKAYRKEAARKIANILYCGFHRFIPLLASKMNFKICQVEIKHKPRIYGRSKYSFFRFLCGGKELMALYFMHSSKKTEVVYLTGSLLIIFFGLLFMYFRYFFIGAVLFLMGSFILNILYRASRLAEKSALNLDMVEQVIT